MRWLKNQSLCGLTLVPRLRHQKIGDAQSPVHAFGQGSVSVKTPCYAQSWHALYLVRILGLPGPVGLGGGGKRIELLGELGLVNALLGDPVDDGVSGGQNLLFIVNGGEHTGMQIQKI